MPPRAVCYRFGSMRLLVTGSSGHLVEALMRVLGGDDDIEVVGLDVVPSPYTTTVVGSVADRALVRGAVEGVDAVIHAATLHKPHVASNGRAEFVETNVTGTLTLLEAAVLREIVRHSYRHTTASAAG